MSILISLEKSKESYFLHFFLTYVTCLMVSYLIQWLGLLLTLRLLSIMLSNNKVIYTPQNIGGGRVADFFSHHLYNCSLHFLFNQYCDCVILVFQILITQLNTLTFISFIIDSVCQPVENNLHIPTSTQENTMLH